MKVLVVGGGAREHALVWKLAGERGTSDLVCAPGNAGIARTARCATVDTADPERLAQFVEREAVDFTVVGPELPLERGAANLFAARGLPIFGPTREAARLETSKAFAKAFMARHGVPTARYRFCERADEALRVIEQAPFGYPVVIKADGLAAGKGVVVAPDCPTAEQAVRAAMIDQRFGDAGRRLVIEEYLDGEEASFFAICDGRRALPLGSAQDHKRVFDEDRGPNTGGMGAFAPSPLLPHALEDRVMRTIVQPTLAGLAEEGAEYRGFLYAGLMLTSRGPSVVEFNVRLGDPEAQVVLPLLETDLLPLLAAAAAGSLDGVACRQRGERYVGVVLASAGYPDRYEIGKVIEGVDEAERLPDVLVFHAGTASRDGRLVTAGGRVLTAVGRGDGYQDAIARAYDAVARIRFEGMHYRRDIGRKAL